MSNYKFCYSSQNIVEIACLKSFLETEEINYQLLNEGFLGLSLEAIAYHEAVASFYLFEEDIPIFQEFIKNGYV